MRKTKEPYADTFAPPHAPTGWIKYRGLVYGRIDSMQRVAAEKLLAWHPEGKPDFYGWKNYNES